MSETEHSAHETPAELAEKLAAKAARESDPGVRAYLLEWADLFSRLANLGANARVSDAEDPEDRPN